MESWQVADAFARATIGQDRIFRGLERVVPRLAAVDVDVLALKGIHLAWTLYERPFHRPLGDADLLVRDRDFPKAAGTLARLGARLTPTARRKVVALFDETDGPWKLDLHGTLWQDDFLALDVEDAWARARPWSWPGGPTILVPPREFTFAHVAAHFARNAYTASNRRESAEIGKMVSWAGISHPALVDYLRRGRATAAAYYALSAAAVYEPSAQSLGLLLDLPHWRSTLLRSIARGPGIPHRLLQPLLTDRRLHRRRPV